MAGALLNATCLQPKNPLRRQLIVSYGITAVLTILLVVILAIIAAFRAGNVVKDNTRKMLRSEVILSIRDSSKYTADIFTARFGSVRGTATLAAELVRDRIVGYPDQGYEDDQNVPFLDIDTQRNKYPLKTPPLPRDWEITLNVNKSNLDENFQERASYFAGLIDRTSTASASFSFPGNCDPTETDPKGWAYFENCTDANNDATLGGVIHPVGTTRWLAEKAADIGIFLKPLWEAEPDAISITVDFHNSGAGATLKFPSSHLHSTSSYVSEGCDWMNQTNPYTGEPFATAEEMQRCHPPGTVVQMRDHNPMERAFCRDQALNPGETRFFGPFLDSQYVEWRITIGQSIFDRLTGQFIGCMSVDLSSEVISRLLVTNIKSKGVQVALVKMDGTVVAGFGWNVTQGKEALHVRDTDFIEEELFKKLSAVVDWEKEWEPQDVRIQLANNMEDCDGVVMTAYPFPRPPEEYDPRYRPDSMIVFSVGGDVFEVLDAMDDAIDDDVRLLAVHSILIGISGLVVILLMVWFVSRVLTLPLNYMDVVAWRIINHTDGRAGETLDKVADDEQDPLAKCSPRTEITELVSEFQKMIRGFSGGGPSSVSKSKIKEIPNCLTWQEEFSQLYDLDPGMKEKLQENAQNAKTSYTRRLSFEKSSILSSINASNFSAVSQDSEDSAVFRMADLRLPDHAQKHVRRTEFSTTFQAPATRTNLGSNIGEANHYNKTHLHRDSDETVRISRSSLFRWIVGSIVVPLLLTNCIICALVSMDIAGELPMWVERSRSMSFDLELEALRDAASLRASLAERVLTEPLRDLHLLTRFTGWLLFDGINRSDSFSDLEMEFVEECKDYPADDESCPFYSDPVRSPCDCEWDDPWNRQCDDFQMETRRLQTLYFLSQARDFNLRTGNRNRSITYPRLDFSPETTTWWTNASKLPGAFQGSAASGYERAYDRLRVSSAMAAVSIPIYNYVTIDRLNSVHSSMSSYIYFEADGMNVGYSGCNYDFARYAHFVSTEANGAYAVNPGLCPLGKFGYDPRCRGWYAVGKERALEGDPIYLTPPYQFAAVTDVGTSAVSPLIDPQSGEFIGLTLIDFSPLQMLKGLNQTNSYFYYVISPSASASDDTIIGPGHGVGDDPAAIADVILPLDALDSKNRADFANVIYEMKEGQSGEALFTRTAENGAVEKIRLAYAPVYARTLSPARPDDFARGSNYSHMLLYSVAVARLEKTLAKPFTEIEDGIREDLGVIAIVYLSLVIVISLLCVVATARISTAVTKPMMTLLRIVQTVNARGIEDDIPPLEGGSREVTQVYNSFAKLYKIVRVSNSSFFSGELKWAYHIGNDAKKLFQRVNDEKAVAIACNNIGNTLLAMSLDDRNTGSCNMVDGMCCIKAALQNFNEAVTGGSREFDSSNSDDVKASYAQQLADRLFNRGMLYLHSTDDSCTPDNAKELGYADLIRCRELDRGVREYFLDRKLLFKKSDLCFDRLLRRLHGLASLRSVDPEVWQVWDVNDLVEEADLMLQAAWSEAAAPLFMGVGKVGRLQQLEGAVMSLELNSGKNAEAARLGMRMLVEDEYIIDTSFVVAAEALLRFMRERSPSSRWAAQNIFKSRREIRKMLKSSKNTSLDTGKSLIFCVELGEKWGDDGALNKLNSNCLSLYDEQCGDDDYVGMVSFSEHAERNLILKLSRKETGEYEQRKALDVATRFTVGNKAHPTFPSAADMVVVSAASRTTDTFIIYITDGSTWNAGSKSLMEMQIDRLNSKRSVSIDIIIIGLELGDRTIADEFRGICLTTRSRHSVYIDATRDTVDSAFDQAASLISSRGTSASRRIQLGITMEKF